MSGRAVLAGPAGMVLAVWAVFVLVLVAQNVHNLERRVVGTLTGQEVITEHTKAPSPAALSPASDGT